MADQTQSGLFSPSIQNCGQSDFPNADGPVRAVLAGSMCMSFLHMGMILSQPTVINHVGTFSCRSQFI